jgi:hypothetical protein
MIMSEPEQSLLMKEVLDKLYSNLILRDKLKVSKRKNAYRDIDIVIGRAVHGMTFCELANEYGVSAQTIRMVYNRNLAYFARVMKKEDLMDLKGYQ